MRDTNRLLRGLCVPVFTATLLLLLTLQLRAAKIGSPPRIKFTVDPKTPWKELLPLPPDVTEPLAPWLVKDLTAVPEIKFQKPLGTEITTRGENSQSAVDAREKAMEKNAHVIAKINHLNQKGTDHFMKVLIESRPDLAGLPFVFGDACRMSKGVSRQFAIEVLTVLLAKPGSELAKQCFPDEQDLPNDFWGRLESFRQKVEQQLKELPTGRIPTEDEKTQARIAALMQMLVPDAADIRQGLVSYLGAVKHQDADRALTRLAVFSFEEGIRANALATLKKRTGQANADLFLAGLRYPWPAIAEHAADAIVKLDRKDLLPNLVEFLDEPDPRAQLK